MDYKYLKVTQEGPVAIVSINRPEQRNALNTETLYELIDAFTCIDRDASVRAAILTAVGKAFVGGADLKEMVHMDSMDYMAFGSIYTKLNKSIRENKKPVIAAVNGLAFGGGNVMLLSADIVLASEKAKFGLLEINLGIFGGAYLMPSLIGRYRASELVLTGDVYTAQQAYEMGIVNHVLPPDELMPAAMEMAKKISAKAPAAVAFAKKSLLNGTKYDVDTACDMQLPLMSILYSGHDQKEGMNAFFEKREPQYTGR